MDGVEIECEDRVVMGPMRNRLLIIIVITAVVVVVVVGDVLEGNAQGGGDGLGEDDIAGKARNAAPAEVTEL